MEEEVGNDLPAYHIEHKRELVHEILAWKHGATPELWTENSTTQNSTAQHSTA